MFKSRDLELLEFFLTNCLDPQNLTRGPKRFWLCSLHRDSACHLRVPEGCNQTLLWLPCCSQCHYDYHQCIMSYLKQSFDWKCAFLFKIVHSHPACKRGQSQNIFVWEKQTLKNAAWGWYFGQFTAKLYYTS